MAAFWKGVAKWRSATLVQDELNALHLERQELEGKSKALETQLKKVTSESAWVLDFDALGP